MKNVLIVLSLAFSASVFSQEMSSSERCYAYTVCPNGGVVSCEVYGSEYVNTLGGGVQESSCSWSVAPYQAVRCSGWQAQQDAWGNMYWEWMDSGILNCQ